MEKTGSTPLVWTIVGNNKPSQRERDDDDDDDYTSIKISAQVSFLINLPMMTNTVTVNTAT